MANITLNWTPGGGAGSQTIQYKVSTVLAWSTYSVESAVANTVTVSGLADNVIYDFRILNACAVGSPTTGAVVQQIKITCPAVSSIPTYNTIPFTFPANGGSVTNYTIDLLDAAGVTVLDTKTATTGVTIANTFTGLTASTDYNIRVTMTAGTFSKICGLIPISTLAPPVCNPPTGITAVLAA